MPLEVEITNEQKIKITARPQTAAGNPAPVDGNVEGNVISGDCTVESVPGDPLSIYIVSGENPGDSTVLVEVDADIGEGVVLIQDTVTARVIGAMAVNMGLVASTPEVK